MPFFKRMSRLLQVPEDARRFAYIGDDCLYRDHLGRRVVADIEGDGFYRVEHTTSGLLIIRGGEDTGRFTGSFDNGLIVLADSPGEVLVRVRLGDGRPDGPSESIGDAVEGAGWVVAANGAVEVDDRKEPAPDPTEEFAIPYFRSAKGQNLTVVKAETRCDLIDVFSIADEDTLRQRGFAVQNISAVSELASSFGDSVPYAAPVASHLNAATWRLVVREPLRGLILRKVYDRFHGRQRARVLVDGRFAGWWYEPVQNRVHRWAVSDFGIPGRLVQPGEIEITVDPPAGSPLWSLSQVMAFAVH